MSKIKIQLVEDEEETPTVFERFWDAFVDFMTLLGVVATVAFIAGYLIVSQAPVEKPSTGVGANTSKGKKV